MIELGTLQVALDDPRLWAAGAALVLFGVLLRASLRSARAVEPLARHLADLNGAVRALNDGQHQLHGGLTHVAETQAAAQARMAQAMEGRLAEVTKAMGDSLNSSAVRTARSLGELQLRLENIDRAQTKIEKLSGDVLGLQDILSNKQTRGAFGEIQLHEIVTRALPPDVVTFQATLSTGVRADCLIDLPQPPGPIVIDAKFPLEPYEALRAAKSPQEVPAARRLMRGAVRARMRAIAEKYVIAGETAEGALMFLPSEAVYAELHANFGDLVREGFGLRVWIVSPTTCMATLHTLRAVLKDVACAPRRTRSAASSRCCTATSSGCRRGSEASTATSPRRRRTSRRSASPPTRRRAAPGGSRRTTSRPRQKPRRSSRAPPRSETGYG